MVAVSTLLSGILGKHPAEELTAGEAQVLWEDLVVRYDVLELSEFFRSCAEDSEFKLLLTRGCEGTLKSQITELEQLLQKYKIALPDRPPKMNTDGGAVKEAVRDELIFRVVLRGMQDCMDMHARALRAVVNDGLRNLFMGHLTDELKMYDNWVKYGKVKGWIKAPPAYRH